MEVWFISFGEAFSADHVCRIVLKNATSCIQEMVNPPGRANICDVEYPDYICPNSFWTIVLAPIDIGSPRNTSSIDYMSWLVFLNFGDDSVSALGP